jgi:CRP/FNR family cyclic AMP-dependent transcriptional regulator
MGVWDLAIRNIADPVARQLAARGQIRTFARGDLLIREHDRSDSVYVLLAGNVQVFVADARGREMILAHYRASDFVGEMALDGKPRSASVRTLDETVCSVVARELLLDMIRANPELALHLYATIIARARSTTGSLKSLALMDVYGRVARLLREQEYVPGEDGLLWSRERLTQQEIAKRVGASRDMISRIFKDLRAGGYIATRDRRITILRRPPARW